MANCGPRRPPPLELGVFRIRDRREPSPLASPRSTSNSVGPSPYLCREPDSPLLPQDSSPSARESSQETGHGIPFQSLASAPLVSPASRVCVVSASLGAVSKTEFPSLLGSPASRFSVKRLSLWAFKAYNFFTTRCLLPIRLYAANSQVLLLYAFLLFGRIVEFLFHFSACVVPAFFYVFFAMFLNLVTVPPPSSPVSPSLSSHDGALDPLLGSDAAASQLDAAVDSLVRDASRSTVNSHLSGALRVAPESMPVAKASTAAPGTGLSPEAAAALSDMPPRVFQRSSGGLLPGRVPVPRGGGLRREGQTADTGTGVAFQAGTQGPAGHAEESVMPSIGLAYVYFVISQVCCGLLLEVPLYTFSLYFAQLLHLQSLTFSLSPQCRQAAEVSAVHYNQAARDYGLPTNQRRAAGAAPVEGDELREERLDERREQEEETQGRGAGGPPGDRPEGDRHRNRLQRNDPAAVVEELLREAQEAYSIREVEGGRGASPSAERRHGQETEDGQGVAGERKQSERGSGEAGEETRDEDETSSVVSSSLQTPMEGSRNTLRSSGPVWGHIHSYSRGGHELAAVESPSRPPSCASSMSRSQPVEFTAASDPVDPAERRTGTGEGGDRPCPGAAETPSRWGDARVDSRGHQRPIPDERDARDRARISRDRSAAQARQAEAVGSAPPAQEGQGRDSSLNQRFFAPAAAVHLFVRLSAHLGINRLVWDRRSGEGREQTRRRRSRMPSNTPLTPSADILATAWPHRAGGRGGESVRPADRERRRETAYRELGRIGAVLNTLRLWTEETWKGSPRRLVPCLDKFSGLFNRIRTVGWHAPNGRFRFRELVCQLHPYRLLSVSPLVFFPSASQRLFFTTFFFWLLRCIYEDGAEDAVTEDAWTFLVNGGNLIKVAVSFSNYNTARLAGIGPRYYSAFSSYSRSDTTAEAAQIRPASSHPFVSGFASPVGGIGSFSLARQWTVWWAVILLGLLFISYSLLALFSAFGVLPWQLLHSLLIHRHTRVATYAQQRERETKERREKRRRQWEALQATSERGAAGREGDSTEAREDEPRGEAVLREWREQEGIRRRRHAASIPEHIPLQLSAFRDEEEDEEEICIFCFEEFKPEDILRVVNGCGHKFHRHCVDVWLFKRQKETCPMCGQLRSPRRAK